MFANEYKRPLTFIILAAQQDFFYAKAQDVGKQFIILQTTLSLPCCALIN